MLFHYNGHGVPRPTANGEIWVFNSRYTQYIPLSIYELQVRGGRGSTRGGAYHRSQPAVVAFNTPPPNLSAVTVPRTVTRSPPHTQPLPGAYFVVLSPSASLSLQSRVHVLDG